MRSRERAIALGLALIAMVAVVAISACAQAPTPTPAPTATPKPTPPPPLGMAIGQRFHDIHTTKLQVKCETCHPQAVGTYYDPLAQVSNLADRRACLSCHKEEAVQPFYGEAWGKAKVGR